VQLAELCKSLETCGRDNQLAESGALLLETENQYEKVKAALALELKKVA
jgi:hypothetical protein